MNTRWHILSLVLLLSLSSPFARALSLGAATNLSEAVGSTIALADWDRANGATEEGGYYWLDTGVLGQGYFLKPNTGAKGTWFWMNDTWLYGEAGNSPYFYIPTIGGWAYNILGTAWFADLSRGEWFQFDKTNPSSWTN